jgi:hypothetical protein
MCYHKFKSETLNSLRWGPIGELPFNTFKRAKTDCHNNSRYINLWVLKLQEAPHLTRLQPKEKVNPI